MDTHQRYLHDPIFKSIVDAIHNLISVSLELNYAEIEEAARLAIQHYEQRHPIPPLTECPYCNRIHDTRIGCPEYMEGQQVSSHQRRNK